MEIPYFYVFLELPFAQLQVVVASHGSFLHGVWTYGNNNPFVMEVME